MTSFSVTTTPRPTRPDRPWLTVLACVAGAAIAFALGRATAQNGTRTQDPAAISVSKSNQALTVRSAATKRQTASTLPGGIETTAATGPLDAAAKKEAEIIALLTQLKTSKRNDLGPEFLGLVAWVNSASVDDLELLSALGQEILPDDNPGHSSILSLAFTRWTDLDAPAAFAAYLALPEDERTPHLAKIVFVGWMRQGSPREAIDHALAMQRTAGEHDPLGEDFVGYLLEDLFKSDRAQAHQIVLEFARSGDANERQAAGRVSDGLIRAMVDDAGPAAALVWIDDWPIPEARSALRSSLLHRLLNGDADERQAAVQLFDQIPDPESGIVLSVARQRASVNVPDTQNWLMTLPPGQLRSAALEGLIENLENEEKLPQLAPWLATKAPHSDFDSAFSRLALETFKNREDFPAAQRLARQVVDPRNAIKLQSQMIARWLEIDPLGAGRVLGPEMEKTMSASVP